MTPKELLSFRTRMGWSRKELAQRLELSPSRIGDYESGHTRTTPPRPAPIPKVVELALRWLAEHQGKKPPISDAEWLARWRDVSRLPDHRTEAGLPPLDDAAVSREALYDPPRGR